MVYLLETDLTNNKPLFLALSEVYGIGLKQSELFCKNLGFSSNLKTRFDLKRLGVSKSMFKVKNDTFSEG